MRLMNVALVYLVERFFWRIGDFFHHWYVHGSRKFAHYFVSFLERVDRTLAFKITLRYFFQPLYKDYSVVGRILGIFFRSGRLLIGLFVYVVLGLLFLAIYIVWVALPVVLVVGLLNKSLR